MSTLANIARKQASQNEFFAAGLASGRVRKVAKVRASNGKAVRNMERNNYADELRSRPGRVPGPAKDLRTYAAHPRFNAEEIAEIDRQRVVEGRPIPIPRGEWLRMSWLQEKPVPKNSDLNRVAWSFTSPSVSNLKQIAGHLELGTVRNLVEKTCRELDLLRLSLTQPLYTKKEIETPVYADEGLRARRGPLPLPAGDARGHAITVRLSREEHDRLNADRGSYMRGEWLRMCWRELHSDCRIPALPQKAYDDLKASSENLNTLAYGMNKGLAYTPELIQKCVNDFGKCVTRARGELT